MPCFRWTGTECKYKPNHTECKGVEDNCVVLHDPFAMFDAMKKMSEEVKI